MNVHPSPPSSSSCSSSPSASQSVPLPRSVEDAIRGICIDQSQPPPNESTRRKLASLGEEAALRVLRSTAATKIKWSIDGFISCIIEKGTGAGSCPSPSPTKIARTSLDGKSPARSPVKNSRDNGFASSLVRDQQIGSLRLLPSLQNGNGQAVSPHLKALSELEFRKAFLILNYTGEGNLEDAIDSDRIRLLKDLSMIEFEEAVWNAIGQFRVKKDDRCKHVDWDSRETHVYHCNISPQGCYRFKGPYLDKKKTLLQKALGDENVLLVKLAEETTDKSSRPIGSADTFTIYKKIAKEGIPVGFRRYKFFVFKDGGKEEKKRDPTTSSVKCYFVCMECEALKEKKTVHEARCFFMHAHTESSVSRYMIRMSLILSKTESLEVDWDRVTIETIKDEECKDKEGNSIYDKKGKPLIHTDGTGFVSEDIALRCPGNTFKGSCAIIPAFEPLLIQFRLFNDGRAVKGTLLRNKQLPPHTIHIRPSMIKVEKDPKLSDIRTVDSLEIVATSNKPRTAYLSKILIALLSYGGVPNEFFLDILKNALGDAKSVFSGKRAALKVSVNHGDMDGFNAARMILSGIPLDESYLQDHLSTLMKMEKKNLKGGRIPISDSYYLMGTADPTGILKSEEVCIILDSGQISGTVLVYRNPGLHFGDIHVLNATYVEALETKVGNSKYAIFFPTSRPRSLTDEIAGGDLDGDMYWVSRNPQLLKYFKPSQPWVSASAAQDVNCKKPSDMSIENLEDELIDLWLNKRFNPSYTVGAAADSWQALMDRLLTLGCDEDAEKRRVERNLSQLVDIYYDALDAPKNGGKIELPKFLKAESFPHYMEKDEAFRSNSILGLIFDTVESYLAENQTGKEIWKIPCFDVEIPRDCLMEWERRYTEYRSEMAAALGGGGAEVKKYSADDVINKYKQLLYGAPEFEESPRKEEDIFNEALAIYHTTYNYAMRWNDVRKCRFAWKVAGPALCRLYAMKQEEKSIVCLPSVLKEIFG
ncbi:probable RNA-dependent RNA polymerase 5 isoform X1 [Syzygium oleosum]|uniref:probable RNA-dependent RNA polymerase 5 isoform X1 n=1 Tax=Syzygium oleosum TaxID=219896 RepID=UPI0024BBEAF4|nr:probable RNA-dependent RNA polymerase 5 isoform X1 [Syzygium oleosum]